MLDFIINVALAILIIALTAFGIMASTIPKEELNKETKKENLRVLSIVFCVFAIGLIFIQGYRSMQLQQENTNKQYNEPQNSDR